jgi:predicted NAD/FAD-binding protein
MHLLVCYLGRCCRWPLCPAALIISAGLAAGYTLASRHRITRQRPAKYLGGATTRLAGRQIAGQQRQVR